MIARDYCLDSVRAASRVSQEGRNRQILFAHEQGCELVDIAKAARLSASQTRRIIQKENAQ